MSRGKWFCRYLFFALLLALCGSFCGYCLYTLRALQTQTEGIVFVELALESVVEAQRVLEQQERFRGLLTQGLVVTGVVMVLLGALIAWHVISKKCANRPAREPKETGKTGFSGKGKPTPAFCPQCGRPIEPGARFCGSCGNNLQ